MQLEELSTNKAFVQRVENARESTLNFLRDETSKGKKIHGYAASTKGNTTLQYYDITPKLIEVIADRNPVKSGKYTVSSSIPVISE